MKKIKNLLLLCTLTFLLTGCVKFNANMDIKKDKSMDFTIIYALDSSVFGEESIMTAEERTEIENKGFTVSDYEEGNMKGVTLSRHVNNIDEVSSTTDADYNLSGLLDSESNNQYIFKIKKGLLKNTYTAKFNFNASDSNLSNTEKELLDDEENEEDEEDGELTENDTEGTAKEKETTKKEEVTTTEETDNEETTDGEEGSDDETTLDSDMDLSDMMSGMSTVDLKFSVTLPNAAISSNAPTKENNGKNLSWNLSSETAESIDFVFELYNMPIIYAGIAVIVLLIGVAVFLVINNKKTKQGEDGGSVEPANDTPVNPMPNNNVAPVAPLQPEVPQPMNPAPSTAPVTPPTELPQQPPVQPNLNQPLNNLINGTPQNQGVVPQPVQPQPVQPQPMQPQQMQPQSIVQPPVSVIPTPTPEVQNPAPTDNQFNGNNMNM